MMVFGTRPEAIKMAPLYHVLMADRDSFSVTLCVTGQHRQMLDQTLAAFEIIADHDLDIMLAGQDLSDITSRILLGMREIFSKVRPDILLVHGDTTTSMAASLAAFYAGVRVGHVEAGLRTYDLAAPYPEELNRQITSRITHWHFTPTQESSQNLQKEGVDPENIFVTGNTVIDALQLTLARIDADYSMRMELQASLSALLPFDWMSDRFVLITGHRRENFGGGFTQICAALRELAEKHPGMHFVYPVHLNPNVQKPVHENLGDLPNVHLLEPLDYKPFVYLLKHCHLVLTDSGGMQEEAPGLSKPVLVMRDVTERQEAVAAGTVKLVGVDQKQIVAHVTTLLNDRYVYASMACAVNPFGDGTASHRIARFLAGI